MTNTEAYIAAGYLEEIPGKPNQVNWVIKVEMPRAIIDNGGFESVALAKGWTDGGALDEVQFCRNKVVEYINYENYTAFLAGVELAKKQQIEAFNAQMAALAQA